MSKPFKSLDSLLRLMRKRNITIAKGTEGSRVKRILARDNYYSVINGYKDIFWIIVLHIIVVRIIM